MNAQVQPPNQRATSYLSPNQQGLLLAALNSQAPQQQSVDTATSSSASPRKSQPDSTNKSIIMGDANGGTLFMSPQNASLDTFDYTPELDYLDGGDNFEFDNADLGGDMIGALPGGGADAETGGSHEKRKASEDEDGADEGGDAKRHDTKEGEKGAKKPGRKPLTSEPTTKRKAQNRAAQRAFRERKEAHLKDLETKVSELTKAQEADKHENGMLKAQVERLQTELKEYRKRLSLTSAAVSRSPPLVATNSQHRSNSNPQSYGSNFQFDFPKFGALPGSQIFGNQGTPSSGVLKRDSMTPPQATQSPTTINGHGQQAQSQAQSQHPRQDSIGRSMSPTSVIGNGTSVSGSAQFTILNPTFASYSTNNNMHGFASTLPQMSGNDGFGDLFSPSLLKSASVDGYFDDSQNVTSNNLQNFNANGGNDSTSGLNRVFQFNSGSSVSDSTSPSASSQSQWNGHGANSSCGTSPEPSHGSPSTGEKSSMPTQKQQSTTSQRTDNNGQANTGMNGAFGLPVGNTNFDVPSLGGFDPVLFGDYRDSNDAIVGTGDFSGGFFDDALNSAPFDYGSPSNLFGILQSPQQQHNKLPAQQGQTCTNKPAPSKSLMAEIENARDGVDDEYGLPKTTQQQQKKTDSTAKLISCNNIWNQLQTNPDFQEGKFDLDGLCSELRAKARCSESGVMVDQDHVDAALRKLGKKDDKGKVQDIPPLMFEQESWDNVLKKLREGRA